MHEIVHVYFKNVQRLKFPVQGWKTVKREMFIELIAFIELKRLLSY